MTGMRVPQSRRAGPAAPGSFFNEVSAMKSIELRTLLFLSLYALTACGEADRPAETAAAAGAPSPAAESSVPKYSAEAFFQTTSYGMVGSSAHAFSADGTALLVSSDKSGVFNAYRLPLDGSEPTMLTNSDDNAVFAVSWFPNDDRILYTYDGGGNELNHVIVREDDGSNRDLTPGDAVKAAFGGWSADNESFYLLTTERNQTSFDLYRYSADDYSRELVYENPGFQLSALSPDGRWLALDKPRTSADSDIYLVDLQAGEREPELITGHEGNVEHGAMGFTADGSALIYGTNEHGEFNQAWQYNIETGEKSPYVVADWDVSYVSNSKSGKYLVYGVNVDARTEVTLRDLASGEDVELPALPEGEMRNVRFSADESHLALIINADNSPSNIHVIDLEDGNTRQLTDALNPEIDPEHLVVSEVVRYRSFDGLEIPSILYKPHGASADHPVPGLVLVHGGPGGQTRTGYRALVQHLVNHGYAILGANNRGSSGYGKTFNHMDDRRHGEEDLQDIVYGRKYLESLDWIDSGRIGVIGGSYGGYMVAAALAFEKPSTTNWATLRRMPSDIAEFRRCSTPATLSSRHSSSRGRTIRVYSRLRAMNWLPPYRRTKCRWNTSYFRTRAMVSANGSTRLRLRTPMCASWIPT
jgi:dipeptidyl aminopeptidase/acylaminoacyl peptidase